MQRRCSPQNRKPHRPIMRETGAQVFIWTRASAQQLPVIAGPPTEGGSVDRNPEHFGAAAAAVVHRWEELGTGGRGVGGGGAEMVLFSQQSAAPLMPRLTKPLCWRFSVSVGGTLRHQLGKDRHGNGLLCGEHSGRGRCGGLNHESAKCSQQGEGRLQFCG